MGLTSGQIVGSVVGGVIGCIWGPGGAMIGMSIGGMVGGWLDPPPAPEPPPLGDISLNSYVHNAPLPLAYGQNKVYGGCIWIGEMGVGMNNGGSKKSPAYAPEMWIEFAVGHCEGEVQEYLKYWLNDKSIEELNESGITFTVRSYNGTSTQTVDPSIESFLVGSEIPAVPFMYTAYSYVYAYLDGSYFSTLPSFSAEIKCFLTETGEEDANPIRVLYDFLTNKRYGAQIDVSWFDGDPDTAGSSWEIAADYCDESVSYEDGDSGETINEPRFRFSHVYDSRTKGYDIVKDILQTCRGILVWCQGKLYVKIETENEEVIGYFSDEYTITLVSTGASTVNTIYFTTAINELAGFWEGAYLNIIIDDITYSEMIDVQGANYVELVDDLNIDLEEISLNGVNVYLTKDNIKESSFNYKKTSKKERYNSIRIEYISRKWFNDITSEISNEYLWDVVEIDQPESTLPYYFSGTSYQMPELSQQQVRLNGIKRRSQAMRMAKWYADFNSYVNFYCEFSTDMVGYLYKVGDIISISHSSIGWILKEFRIVSIEEIENDEVKFSCLEYSRLIFDDSILPVFIPPLTEVPQITTPPKDIERLHIARDETENKIYVNFKRPDDDNWWVAAQIWVKKGLYGDYTRTATMTVTTPSVKLSSSIDNIQTSIPFDNTTLYGAFPTSGQFWIEDELISYTGIANNQFTGCTRGSNASAHDVAEYSHLKSSNTPYLSFISSDIGTTWYIKAISINVANIPSAFEDATELSIELL